MNNTSIHDLSDYEIIKLEQSIILMKHKQTRKTYRYVQLEQKIPVQQLQISNVIMPARVQTGLLYQTGFMTLAHHIQTTVKSGQKFMFKEDEIFNTIEPILKTVQDLHSRGQIHGAIVPDNIIIDHEANIKVYYPGIKDSSKLYYFEPASKQQDDFRALGLIILELLGFSQIKYEDQIKILRTIAKTQKYSQFFIIYLLANLLKTKKVLDELLPIIMRLNGTIQQQKLSNQAKQLFEIQILEKGKKIEPVKRSEKVQFTPPLVKHSQHSTPRKTLQITKKYMKIQDTENKKNIEESKKKKPSDTALKKVSNGKTQAQNNANTASPAYKKILQNIRQTKQRQDLFRMAVTIKRMRTISKKKIN